MHEPSPRYPVPDRLQVFISSTINECKVEREAARRAIGSLNFQPVQFEREGARAEAPRDFYLRKLHDSHIVIGIYRNSYGWIDEAKGMAISGLEDEYREAKRLGKDLLAYVLKTASDRDARLSDMLNELMASPHVLYFYDEGEDLETRIRDDLTQLVTERVVRSQGHSSGGSTAAGLLESIFRGSPFRIRRAGLLAGLTSATVLSRIVWVTGAAGAGKTALLAEWASERSAAYVNARGLDPRAVLAESAKALGLADEAGLVVPVFDDARTLLLGRWQDGRNWPLVIDDPDDVDAVWAVLSEGLGGSGAGSVIVVARDVDSRLPGHRFEVAGFSEDELAALHLIAGQDVSGITAGQLPLELRRSNRADTLIQRFEALDAPSREVLGYMALSPAPLALEDFCTLLGGSVSSAMELADRFNSLSDLLMENPAGYSFVHDVYREDLAQTLSSRPQLKGLLTERLAKHLASTSRAWAAFALRREEDSANTEQLANRAVREAVFSGSTRHLVDALEYLAAYYRARAERGPLVSVLMSLAEARTTQGRLDEAPHLLGEALSLAREMGDDEAQCDLEILQASLDLRRSASCHALERIRELREAAQVGDRPWEEARLLIEEGTALLGVNEAETAVPIFRKARDIFTRIDDSYGVETATRNLIMALTSIPDGIAESERLRAELSGREAQSPRYRAWLCNLLVPRLRRDKRFAEAEAMAREAIGIGESLGDRYLIAINTLILANVLREAGQTVEAIEAYSTAGRIAQGIGRPDIEGKTSRLLALTENGEAEASSGAARREHAGRAEQYATHAIGLLAGSFGWSEYALALEERGDARKHLNREDDAINDYADAVASFLQAEDEDEAERLLRYLIRLLEERKDSAVVIARAFGKTLDSADAGRSGVWVGALVAALNRCPRSIAPRVLGVLVRSFYPAADGEWWFDCLVRCLLKVDVERSRGAREAIGSLLLLAVLGFGRHRAFTVQQLLVLAGLCIGETDSIVMRHRPGADLTQIIHLGERRILFTVRDEAKRPEATFVALIIGAFLDAFGDELSTILFGNGFTEGVALDVIIFSQVGESPTVSEFIAEGLKDKPVATARIEGEKGAPIVVFARTDAIELLRATPNRGGELEVMLARFLHEVLYATVGASIDDEIYSSKIRDLLMSVLG